MPLGLAEVLDHAALDSPEPWAAGVVSGRTRPGRSARLPARHADSPRPGVLGLISKLAGTHRYHLTQAGRIVITAILTALRASVRQLTAAAA